MNKNRSKKSLLLPASLLILALCLLTTIVLSGFGLTVWFTANTTPDEVSAQSTQPSYTLVQWSTPPTHTPTPTTISTATSTATPSPTNTPLPTDTPSPTPSPTETPLPPPTDTPTSPPPPTSTPLPADTPTPPPPDHPFIIKETAKYNTNHPNFDVYVGITDTDNNPLSSYSIIGTHSSGLQLKSAVSVGVWSQNSGAMHYKAGNIKYESFNSPSGIWSLQLVDEHGTPVAPSIDFSFDAANPTWYFLLYQRQ